ncbi:MAG: hypothetical protein AB1765_04690, partial [Candidatus Hydrogenedentota bacterium]
AYADFNRSLWQYRKPILSLPNSEFTEWLVDYQVYNRCGKDLLSLRLIDENGSEVAYVIKRRPPDLKINYIISQITDFTRGKDYIRFEIDTGRNQQFHNYIEFSIKKEEYHIPVTIEGSSDQQNWKVLRDKAYILRYQTDHPVSGNELYYTQSNLRFLRITFKSSLLKEENLISVRIARVIKESGELVERKFTKISETIIGDQYGPDSVILLDLEKRGFTHQELSLICDDKTYTRIVDIYDGDSSNGPWQYIGTGSIYKYGGEKNDIVEYDESIKRFIKVVIHNYDESPLTVNVISVRGVPRYIVFPTITISHPEFLYYCNNKARMPIYDFSRECEKKSEIPEASPAELGNEEPNPYFKGEIIEKPFCERYPWVIYIALGSGIIILGLIAALLMKPQPPTSSPH